MNIQRAFDKALTDYSMIQEGDRILIGASGGKDSLVLSALLAQRARQSRPSFTLRALGVLDPLHREDGHWETIAGLYDQWKIPLELRRTGDQQSFLIDNSTIDQASPSCYRCSTRRRVTLMKRALELNCNKLALGHHLDDILTTILMNLVLHGEKSGMEAVRYFEKFKVGLIRPLVYVPEESIRRYICRMEWPTAPSCSRGDGGMRAEFRRRLETLSGASLEGKLRLLRGLYGRSDP